MITPTGPAPPSNLLDLGPTDLEAMLVKEFGEPAYRSGQLLHAIYREGRRDLDAMTNLPAELRRTLAARFPVRLPAIEEVQRSRDGSRKFLLRLVDGLRIEAVHIVDGSRITFCISSQVGCAFGCDFCLTARMKLVRHLTVGEIVGQVLRLADHAECGREGYNVVFMGMGEPLHNFEAVASALEILQSRRCMNISYRRITLSTVGDVPGIRRLGALRHRPRLAVSLNATDDVLRSRMMPVNRAHPLGALMEALRAYPLRRRERITFEYVLMAGVNDSLAAADSLASLIRRIPSKVNLIPFNEVPELPQAQPTTPVLDAFRERLRARGVATSIRRSRGEDIRAACGQLLSEVAP